MTDERDLRDRFQGLRDDLESSGVPDFDAMWARAASTAVNVPRLEVHRGEMKEPLDSTRGRVVSAGGWISLATAAAAAALIVVGPTRSVSDPEADFERVVESYLVDGASGGWSSPTASLLRIPGVDLGDIPDVSRTIRDESINGPRGRGL